MVKKWKTCTAHVIEHNHLLGKARVRARAQNTRFDNILSIWYLTNYRGEYVSLKVLSRKRAGGFFPFPLSSRPSLLDVECSNVLLLVETTQSFLNKLAVSHGGHSRHLRKTLVYARCKSQMGRHCADGLLHQAIWVGAALVIMSFSSPLNMTRSA